MEFIDRVSCYPQLFQVVQLDDSLQRLKVEVIIVWSQVALYVAPIV